MIIIKFILLLIFFETNLDQIDELKNMLKNSCVR